MHVDVVIAGPRGREIGIAASDSAFVVADPVLTGRLGWKSGAQGDIQASTTLNVPAGQYREGDLANLAFHRWADDLSLAATSRDPASGWDVTGKLGVTFNGKNPAGAWNTATTAALAPPRSSITTLGRNLFDAEARGFSVGMVGDHPER